MKKIIELYRKYGVSQAKLRYLAACMEQQGRARKDPERNIWYLEEGVVIEYLAGEHREQTQTERKKSPQEELESLREKIATLEIENDGLRHRLQKAQHWAKIWKSMAKKIKNANVIIAESEIPSSGVVHDFYVQTLPELWQHAYAVVNGIRLHYVTQGQGKLLILLHGFPEFWYSWRYQIPFLARYFRVVALDMRGYNESDKPKGVHSYRLDTISEDIRQLIQSLGEKQAIVIGHDIGGMVSWNLAMHYPQVVSDLIVLNAPHPHLFLKHLGSNLRQMVRSWYIFWFQVPWLPELFILRDPSSFIRSVFLDAAVYKDEFTRENLDLFTKAITQPRAITAAINYYRAGFRQYYKLKKDFIHISCPALQLWGENDPAFGKELMYDTSSYSNYCEIKRIPNCGHTLQQQQPELVNQYILEFLKGA